MTSSGTEPVTFRFVADSLDQQRFACLGKNITPYDNFEID